MDNEIGKGLMPVFWSNTICSVYERIWDIDNMIVRFKLIDFAIDLGVEEGNGMPWLMKSQKILLLILLWIMSNATEGELFEKTLQEINFGFALRRLREVYNTF